MKEKSEALVTHVTSKMSARPLKNDPSDECTKTVFCSWEWSSSDPQASGMLPQVNAAQCLIHPDSWIYKKKTRDGGYNVFLEIMLHGLLAASQLPLHLDVCVYSSLCSYACGCVCLSPRM